MKKTRLGFLAGVFALSLVAFGVGLPYAQAGMNDLPEGDYQMSCMGCMVNLNLLNCQCRDDKGMVKPSSLMLTGCNHDISNRNGQLVCGNA